MADLSEQLNQKRTQFAPRKKFAFRSRPAAVASDKTTTGTSYINTSNNDNKTDSASNKHQSTTANKITAGGTGKL